MGMGFFFGASRLLAGGRHGVKYYFNMISFVAKFSLVRFGQIIAEFLVSDNENHRKNYDLLGIKKKKSNSSIICWYGRYLSYKYLIT